MWQDCQVDSPRDRLAGTLTVSTLIAAVFGALVQAVVTMPAVLIARVIRRRSLPRNR